MITNIAPLRITDGKRGRDWILGDCCADFNYQLCDCGAGRQTSFHSHHRHFVACASPPRIRLQENIGCIISSLESKVMQCIEVIDIQGTFSISKLCSCTGTIQCLVVI